MIDQELIEKLNTAQALLSDVYHYACDNGLEDVESQMRMIRIIISVMRR